MSLGQEALLNVGLFQVFTTNGVGHSPEFYAERIVERLIYISTNAPPEIKLQALAFRDRMQDVLVHEIRQAIVSNHTTMYNKLKKAGMHEAAQLVLEMRSE